jgi:signal transduction histidine kinase
MYPEDLERVWHEVQMAVQENRHFEFTYRVRARDGGERWVWERGRAVHTAEGGLEALEGFIADVTEQRQIEEQLRQAQKMEAVGQLTGGVAHDFNNLLTVIMGNAEILFEGLTDPRKRANAEAILKAAERGSSLTQQLLAFGRRQSLRPEAVRLDQVVDSLTPLLHRTLGEHIDLRTEYGQGAPAALADRSLLENAILNLALNARDAMPRGGTLTIRTGERIAGPGNGSIPIGQPVVFVALSDTGTGMAPEILARVFEPFFTTKDVGKGSGLGLSMVYGFAEQSGGHVSITSTPGGGTTVTILLRAVGNETKQVPKDEGTFGNRGHGRVLLVEDEAAVCQFVSSQLADLGYEVRAVSCGPEALALLAQDGEFDLLFTDVVLPKGMSGVELADHARRINPRLQVVLTSGYPREVFEHHGRPDADLEFLRKPYKRSELAEMLKGVLERTRPRP